MDLTVCDRSVPILMYHQITPSPADMFKKYAITPKAFERQMRWLAGARYTVITLDALLDYREGRQALPKRAVIITFDDGFQDCFNYAAPILNRYHFTATFFLVAGLMSSSSRWLLKERGIEFPIMDWAMARQLESRGFTCGAHTMTHPHLAALSTNVARHELHESRVALEQHLGHSVVHLAYPFGSYDERVRVIADEVGYRSACTVHAGLSSRLDPPLELRRVPITGHDSLPDFLCRVQTGQTVYEFWQRKAHYARLRVGAARGRAAAIFNRPPPM